MKVLMVLTSHDQLGDTGKKTGFWLEEFAAPYYAFKDAGAEVTLVSPKGGRQAHGLATAVGGLPFRRYITGNVAVMRLGHCTLVELSPQTPKTLTGGPAQV